MLSKQLTSKLKQEQEKENQMNPTHLSIVQCDRLIRAVSCKVTFFFIKLPFELN